MPHLVEMQHQWGKDGLIVMTLDLDDPEDMDIRQDVVKFLKDNKITLLNLVIAEGDDLNTWLDKLDVGAFPTTFVYDRDGKLVKRFEGAEPAEIEKYVQQQLKN
ncbi:MAG: TlpA family protein disulfide reductase [Gemmataceae bacterium]